MSVWILLLMTCTSVSQRAVAQSQDQLRETLDFLKLNLERHASWKQGADAADMAVSTSFEPVRFETCSIAWRTMGDFGPSNREHNPLSDFRMQTDVSVDLASIDPAKTRTYIMEKLRERNVPWSLVLELGIRPRSPGFRLQMTTSRDGRVTRSPRLETRQHILVFNVADRQIVKDISRAFANGSNLCRTRTKRRL